MGALEGFTIGRPAGATWQINTALDANTWTTYRGSEYLFPLAKPFLLTQVLQQVNLSPRLQVPVRPILTLQIQFHM